MKKILTIAAVAALAVLAACTKTDEPTPNATAEATDIPAGAEVVDVPADEAANAQAK